MNIEIKISRKRVEYSKAINYLEKRVKELNKGISKELIWILEHPSVFTAGVSYKKEEILDKSINILQTYPYIKDVTYQKTIEHMDAIYVLFSIFDYHNWRFNKINRLRTVYY